MRYKNTIAVTILVLLVILLFFDILISDGSRIISSPSTDIAHQFLYFRDFGFGELKKGNLALWNPYLFSGAPFLGGFQSALLYPLNFPYLFLPLGHAINIGIVLHAILLGVFTYMWARGRELSPVSSFLSAVLLVFSGAHFPHIFAGHLSNLCAMTWIPLIFLCLDRILSEGPSWKWIITGIGATSMQILAGHPQYVYYTALVSAIYVFLHTLRYTSDKKVFVKNVLISFMSLTVLFFGSVLLCAVQIFTGIDAARESARAGGVHYSFAAMFSFPPENFLTLFAPNLFGGLDFPFYWGRLYYWEANLFIGIAGFSLILYALLRGKIQEHILGITSLISLLLALGARTPLFDILYGYLPGFNMFRGTAKFIFFVNLFACLLAGKGFHLLSELSTESIVSQSDRRLVRILFTFTAITVLMALLFALTSATLISPRWWHTFLSFIASSGETYVPVELYGQNDFVLMTASAVASQLMIAALVFVLIAFLWHRITVQGGRRYRYFILVVAIAEVMTNAAMTRASFDIHTSLPQELNTLHNELKGDERVLNLWRPNSALSTHLPDIWGYDPGVSKRYAEFITFTQGGVWQNASQYVAFSRYHPLLKLTRLRYVIVPDRGGGFKIHRMPDPMPHVLIVPRWKYISSGEDILNEMGREDFNPYDTVIVEKELPLIPSTCTSPGTAKLEVIDTDTMVVESETPCDGVLLITDTYSSGWHATPITKAQFSYEILRANYTFMAIPLKAGRHILRLEYTPVSYKVGKWISLASFVLYACAAISLIHRLRTRRHERRD